MIQHHSSHLVLGKKLSKQSIAIQCPVHKEILEKGIRASINLPGMEKKKETNIIFYCPKCQKLYFTSYKFAYGRAGRLYGIITENIKTPIFKDVDGQWQRVKKKVEKHSGEKIAKEKTAEIERAEYASKRFDPRTDTLYIHKGLIKCLQDKHDVISVTLRVPTEDDKVFGTVNANYCFNCDKFFMSLDEYNVYKKKNQIMLVRFQFVEDGIHGSYGDNWAEKSPLMLAGYSVSVTKGYVNSAE